MITLYHRDDCPFCWKVRLALHALDVTAPLVPIARGHKPPALPGVPAQTGVPVLVHDGLAMWESSIILDYLIDTFAGSHLLPEEPAARVRARQLQCYSDGAVGCALRQLIFEKRSKASIDWDEALIANSDAEWRACLDWIEGQVEPSDTSGGGLLGAFSIADCALLPRFGLADHYGAGVDARHPKLAAWFERQRQSRSFQSTEPARPHW